MAYLNLGIEKIYQKVGIVRAACISEVYTITKKQKSCYQELWQPK